jgi:hypothetical protein
MIKSALLMVDTLCETMIVVFPFLEFQDGPEYSFFGSRIHHGQGVVQEKDWGRS